MDREKHQKNMRPPEDRFLPPRTLNICLLKGGDRSPLFAFTKQTSPLSFEPGTSTVKNQILTCFPPALFLETSYTQASLQKRPCLHLNNKNAFVRDVQRKQEVEQADLAQEQEFLLN